jgi:hypothetical protein
MTRPAPARARSPAAVAARAAARATETADTLTAWLRTQQPRVGVWPTATSADAAKPAAVDVEADVASHEPAPGTPGPALPGPAGPLGVATPAPAPTFDRGQSKQRGPSRLPSLACSLPHTDWLHHRLLVTGPAADLAAFRQAAAGAGTIPWQLDLDRVEEDLFHLLVAPPAVAGALTPPARSLSLDGARILAGQLRAASARRHALAIARVGHSRACPFDLHALVPVPDAILRCGPDDPDALAWLWAHWGTTQMLRHVAEDEAAGAARGGRASEHARDGAEHAREGAAGEGVWVLTFWSADWTPWRALAEISAGWPTLRFDTRPTYDTP